MSAGAYQRIGELESSIQWAERAIRMVPDDHAVYYNVACVYSRLKRIDENN
jgi:hypothetical protein